MRNFSHLFIAAFFISLIAPPLQAMDQGPAQAPTHTLSSIIKPKHARDDMFIFVKKIPNNRLVVFTKDGIGEILDLNNGNTLQRFSARIDMKPIKFDDVILLQQQGKLVLVEITEGNLHVYSLDNYGLYYQYDSRRKLKELPTQNLGSIIATWHQICEKQQPELSKDIFDLGSLTFQQHEELIEEWKMLNGQKTKAIKDIYCYNKTIDGDIVCGHDWGRISFWKKIVK